MKLFVFFLSQPVILFVCQFVHLFPYLLVNSLLWTLCPRFFYQLLCLQLHAVVGEPEHHRLPPRPPSEHLKVLRYNAPRDKGPSKKRYEMKFSG